MDKNSVHRKPTLSDETVKEICEMLDEQEYSYIEIGKKFNCSANSVSKIARGLAYTNISKNYSFIKNNTVKGERLSDRDVKEICQYLQDTALSLSDIAEDTGASKTQVYNIYRGKTYIDISKNYNFINREHHNKLSEETVKQICIMLQSGISMRQISNACDCTISDIGKIKRGEAYWNIAKNYNINPHPLKKYSDEAIIKVCELLQDGLPVKDVAKLTDVNEKYISSIKYGKSRRDISSGYDFKNKKGSRELAAMEYIKEWERYVLREPTNEEEKFIRKIMMDGYKLARLGVDIKYPDDFNYK